MADGWIECDVVQAVSCLAVRLSTAKARYVLLYLYEQTTVGVIPYLSRL